MNNNNTVTRVENQIKHIGHTIYKNAHSVNISK